MSRSDLPTGEARYYDPAEVDAYINEATNTIKALQARLSEATRRAEEAERSIGEGQSETASLGRALLLASEVAEKTISDADTRASEIVDSAKAEATAIVAAAQREAARLVDAAQDAAAAHLRSGQERLFAAVGAFVEGANLLRKQLAGLEDDATGWQDPTPAIAVIPTGPTPPTADRGRSFEGAGGIHNRAGRNGAKPPELEGDLPADSSIKVPPLSTPPPIPGYRDRQAPDAG